MLTSQNQSLLEQAETYAPARLARADVAALRQLYDQAFYFYENHALVPVFKLPAWRQELRLYLDRDTKRRALARLGQKVYPHVIVAAQWTFKHVWGLQVDVKAYQQICNDKHTAVMSLTVGEHRFRDRSSRASFVREISRYVRLGFGWSLLSTERSESS